jgi:hypothetical protein
LTDQSTQLYSLERLKPQAQAWVRAWAWECTCLSVFLGLIAFQLFVPPITGLSDNNDFSKVFGVSDICKAPFETLNTYFISGYDAGPKCRWPSGFISSEALFVSVGRGLGRPFTGRYHFDLRWSAAVHLAVLAAAMALFLCLTRRQGKWVRFLLPPLAILMFTDVAYVAWLNSAYMDNASWVLFLLLTSAAASGIAEVYGITGVLLVFSKAQHAVLGIPFGLLAAWFAWRNRRRQPYVWLLSAVALLVSAAVMPALTPPEYANISLYNLIFYRLAPNEKEVLPELGLDAGYQKWVGTQAFAKDSPLPDPDWTRAFTAQVSFADIARLYCRHPGIALRRLNYELHDSVHLMRPDYMANYRQEDGFPPHSVATRFSFWSNLRMRAFSKYPFLILVIYALPLLGAVVRPRLLPLALVLVVAGLSEFAICTLADAIDTHRHLFLFHVITDSVILLTLGWVPGGRHGVQAELP